MIRKRTSRERPRRGDGQIHPVCLSAPTRLTWNLLTLSYRLALAMMAARTEYLTEDGHVTEMAPDYEPDAS